MRPKEETIAQGNTDENNYGKRRLISFALADTGQPNGTTIILVIVQLKMRWDWLRGQGRIAQDGMGQDRLGWDGIRLKDEIIKRQDRETFNEEQDRAWVMMRRGW